MSGNDMLLIPTETLEVIMESLEEHDDRFDIVEAKLEEHDDRFDAIDAKLDDITIIIKHIQSAILEKL